MPIARKKYILEKLQRDGFIKNSDLAERLNVSLATIRRDIKEISKQLEIDISYGGATLKGITALEQEMTMKEKETRNLEAKKIIAKKAARYIEDGQIIALNAGSTVPLILDYVKPEINQLHIVTLGLNIANKVAQFPSIKLILAGGNYRSSSQSFWGTHAERILEDINIDQAFLGANAIDMEKGWSHPNLYEVATNRMLLKNARKKYLVADSSKFGKIALGKVCDLSEFDIVISDDNLPQEYIKFFLEQDIEVV